MYNPSFVFEDSVISICQQFDFKLALRVTPSRKHHFQIVVKTATVSDSRKHSCKRLCAILTSQGGVTHAATVSFIVMPPRDENKRPRQGKKNESYTSRSFRREERREREKVYCATPCVMYPLAVVCTEDDGSERVNGQIRGSLCARYPGRRSRG